MSAFMTQCVVLPSDWPRARTAVGKISARYTQITAPCENAKKRDEPDQHDQQVLAGPRPCP